MEAYNTDNLSQASYLELWNPDTNYQGYKQLIGNATGRLTAQIKAMWGEKNIWNARFGCKTVWREVYFSLTCLCLCFCLTWGCCRAAWGWGSSWRRNGRRGHWSCSDCCSWSTHWGSVEAHSQTADGAEAGGGQNCGRAHRGGLRGPEGHLRSSHRGRGGDWWRRHGWDGGREGGGMQARVTVYAGML